MYFSNIVGGRHRWGLIHMRLRTILGIFLLVANCGWAATKPAGFDTAAQTMSGIAKSDLVNMNALLVAGGYLQGAVLPEFSTGVFEAVRKFQAANGFATTGALTSDEVSALNAAARPFLTYWGLKAVEIGKTPTYVWIPGGLDLSASPVDGDPQSTEYTSERSDIVIFTSSNPGATINEAYSSTLNEMSKRKGARIITKFLIPGKMMSVIVMLNSRRWSYVDFVRNEDGIVGFTLAVDPDDVKLQAGRLHSLMLGSLISSTMQDPWLRDPPFLFAPDKIAGNSTQKNSGSDTANSSLITGTGIVVSTDGDILTNAHVVPNAKAKFTSTRRWAMQRHRY